MFNDTKLSAEPSVLVSIVDRASARNGPTAEATARWVSEHTVISTVTSLGRADSVMSGRKNNVLDGKVADLMSRLYYDAKCGRAAAEYNFEKAGMIEMIFGHVAGQMGDGGNFWDDCRWTLTERGRRAGMAKLERIILRDPPLEIHCGTSRTRPTTSPATVVAPSPAVPSGRPIIAYLLTSQFGLKHSSSREAQEAPMSFLCEKFVVSSGCFHLAVAEDERLGRWRAPNGRVVREYQAPVS